MRPSTVSQWLLTSPLSEKIEDVSLQEKMGEKGEVARGWGGKKVRVWGVGRKKVKKCNQSLSVMVPGTSFYLSSMPRNRAALNHKIPLGPSGMPFFFLYSVPQIHMWMLFLYPSLGGLQPLWHLTVICFSNPQAYIARLSGVTSPALFPMPLITPWLQPMQAFSASLQRREHWPTFPDVSSATLL